MIMDLIERLSKRKVSHLVIEDEVNLMDEFIQKFNFEEQKIIYDFISSHLPSDPCQDTLILSVLSAQPLTADLALRITPPTEKFVTLSTTYRLAYARVASQCPNNFRDYGLPLLSKLLIESGRPIFAVDGIHLAQIVFEESQQTKISGFSDPRQIFCDIVSIGPRLPTITDARYSWSVCVKILSSMDQSSRYGTIRFALSQDDLPEPSRSALIHQIMTEMNNPASNSFRSPLVNELLPYVFTPEFIQSPVVHVEGLMTALNFLRFMLLLDRKLGCYALYRSESGKEGVYKLLQEIKKSIKSVKESCANPEKMLEQLKIFGGMENSTLEDAKSVAKDSINTLVRIEYIISLIEDILNNKE